MSLQKYPSLFQSMIRDRVGVPTGYRSDCVVFLPMFYCTLVNSLFETGQVALSNMDRGGSSLRYIRDIIVVHNKLSMY